jgi:hypothetical protein
MCQELNVPFLGKVPLDPRIAKACDEGKFYLSEYPDSEATRSLGSIFAGTSQQTLFFFFSSPFLFLTPLILSFVLAAVERTTREDNSE